MKSILSLGFLAVALAVAMVLAPKHVNAQESSSDIVDTAAAAGDFTTLVAAVQAAGLVDTLKGEGPFTVFAPTDAAFNALPDGTVDALLMDPTGDLKDILLYHVVSGKVMAGDLSDGMQAPTVLGPSITFSISDSGAMVNSANIVVADVSTSNGVIHVIDAVLLPPSSEAPEELPVTGGASTNLTLIALVSVLGLLLVGGYATRNRAGSIKA